MRLTTAFASAVILASAIKIVLGVEAMTAIGVEGMASLDSGTQS